MSVEIHTIEVPGGLNNYTNSDRVILGLTTITYGAGGSAGAVVTVAVTFTEPIQTPFDVFYAPTADVTAFTTAQTPTGFTVNIEPRLSTATVAAGTIGALIVS